MKSYKDRITHGPPPGNQVPGPVSNDKGHSTSALAGKGQEPQSKGHSTLGHSTRSRLSKGHSTDQLLGQDHSTLGHSTSALPGPKRDLQSKSHSTLGHSTHKRLSKDHSIHQLLRQGHSTLGHSTSALPVHGPADRACQFFRRHRKQRASLSI